MKTFKELCNNKPSVAIKAMVKGLIKQDKRKGFEINMGVFVGVEGDICFGCAATCAIQEIMDINYFSRGVDFNATNNKIFLLNNHCILSTGDDISKFENSINSLRTGDIIKIFEYFEIKNYIFPNIPLHFLGTYDWKENLEPYKMYAKQLEELGL